MRVSAAALFLIAALAGGCRADRNSADRTGRPEARLDAHAPADTLPAVLGGSGEWFTDRAKETGFDFVHFNGMSGKFYQPEIMAPGVALFDYDNDGDLDVYLVQGHPLDGGTSSGATANKSSCPLSLNSRAILPMTKSPDSIPNFLRSSKSFFAARNGSSGKPLKILVYCLGWPMPAARYCSFIASATMTKWVVTRAAYFSAARKMKLAAAF